MSTEVILPTLGESVNEATISRWLKEVGEHVDADEALLEVSTDKVDTEVPSPTSGTLLEIRFKEDDTAPVGAVLAIIGEPSEATPAPATPAAPAPAAPAETPAPPAPAPAAAAPAAGTEVILPNLGESVNEATISRWLKEVGEHVDADEALLEVSTDKVDTEVPSPTSGTLLEIRFKEDDTAPVGAVLAIIGEPSEATPAPATPAAPAPAAPAETPAPPAPAPAAAAPAAGTTPAPAAPRATLPEFEGYVTPLVRKLARDNGIDLATVTGTGVGGRIRKQDVEDAIEAQKAAAAAQQAAAAAPAPAAEKAPSPEAAKKGTTEKMTKLRSIVATRMRESLQVSAQLTATVEVDLSAVTRVRAKAKDEFRKREGVGLTYLAFITKAATEALRDFPKVNASIDSEAGTITYHESEDIGIAVDTPRGLLVPVIRGAGDLNVGGIAKKIGDVAARARDNKIGPDELSGATFTITNYGSTGTLFDTPIINQPNVAILGTGAMVKRPVVVTDGFGNDTIAIRPMMYLSLTYDHRLVDGADASRFLSAVKARLEAGDFGGEFGQAQ